MLGFVLLVLSIRVIRSRVENEVSLGDGGVSSLFVAQRRQGNFVEYVPYAIALLALLEASNASSSMLHTLGATLVIARIAHPFGLATEFAMRAPRFLGTSATLLAIAWMSGALIYNTLIE
jgi:hypothetical protein